jgi:hypothetical protein
MDSFTGFRISAFVGFVFFNSVQGLGVSAEEHICKLSDEEITAIPAEFAQNIAARLRDAAQMGDVMLHI